jgi:hypothetical protein
MVLLSVYLAQALAHENTLVGSLADFQPAPFGDFRRGAFLFIVSDHRAALTVLEAALKKASLFPFTRGGWFTADQHWFQKWPHPEPAFTLNDFLSDNWRDAQTAKWIERDVELKAHLARFFGTDSSNPS